MTGPFGDPGSEGGGMASNGYGSVVNDMVFHTSGIGDASRWQWDLPGGQGENKRAVIPRVVVMDGVSTTNRAPYTSSCETESEDRIGRQDQD